MSDLRFIRDVEVAGRAGLDVRLENGRIAEVGPRLPGRGPQLDGAGGALIPGLIDHHIHLLALAAQADSIRLDDLRGAADLAARLASAAAARPPGSWLRATGYHEGVAGVLGLAELDRLAPRHPVRVQHRSGALWMLNSRALERLMGSEPPPDCLERDSEGRPTGRIWRGDAWMGARLKRTPPPLAPVGRALAACGITGLTDTSATTDQATARLLGEACSTGDLPQRLMLMSGGELAAPEGVLAGPVKILLDEASLPDFDELANRFAQARGWGRRVAVHCVTAAELAFALAVWTAAGAEPGDRIEHGGVIPPEAISTILELGLTVVTQPAFILERGDRYFVEVSSDELASLYRLGSLLRAGVPVAASSDAPYADIDPWKAMRAAVERRTLSGLLLGADERVGPDVALSLYLGEAERPGGAPRRVEPGAPADLCLLRTPIGEALRTLDVELVAATLAGGELIFQCDRAL